MHEARFDTSTATPPERLPCYVLTLDSPSGVRYRSAAGQLARLPLDATFVPGARLAAPAESGCYSAWRNRLFMKRPMTGGEVGVYLGHRRIWERILAAGQDVALALEDDFVVRDETALLGAIADALALPVAWDIVKFFDFKPKVPVQRWRTERTEFVAYKYPPSGCVAYLIRATAASRLLARRTIYRPIDEDWSHPWESGLRIISVCPNPVVEAAAVLGGSLLESERLTTKDRHRSPLRSIHGGVLSVVKNVRALWWRRRSLLETTGPLGPERPATAAPAPRAAA